MFQSCSLRDCLSLYVSVALGVSRPHLVRRSGRAPRQVLQGSWLHLLRMRCATKLLSKFSRGSWLQSHSDVGCDRVFRVRIRRGSFTPYPNRSAKEWFGTSTRKVWSLSHSDVVRPNLSTLLLDCASSFDQPLISSPSYISSFFSPSSIGEILKIPHLHLLFFFSVCEKSLSDNISILEAS